LNLFEDMAGYQLYPTDVTFNVLINACAKRPDYYNEAFSLLEQMQESYGFQPDKITYNTLLTACARKRDLGQARRIFNAMWKDVQTNGMEHSLLVPDSQTYTNLFWCYASSLNTKEKSASSTSSTSTDLTAKQDLLPSPVPTSRSAVVKEARWLFDQAEVQITSALLNAYLTLHITKQQSTSTCVDIYSQLFDKYQVKKDAFTFQHMLQLCYNSKDAKLAWKVWEDYQDYLEERRIQFVLPENNDIAAQKAVESERHALAIKEGWTNTHQQKMVILMSNTLAR
jgi:pentatricopeptide repeat protein